MDWDGRLTSAEKAVRETLERALAALAGPDAPADDVGRSPVDTLASALESHRDAVAMLEGVAREWAAAGCPPRLPVAEAQNDRVPAEPEGRVRVC